MKIVSIFFLFILSTSVAFSGEGPYPYQDPDLPMEKRIDDLLARMTPKEKFWQLFMIPGDLSGGGAPYKNGIFGLQVATRARGDGAAQQMLSYGGSGTARQHAEKINEIQKFFVEETRLGIPIIAFDEALHGLVRDGATAFPQAIALAATWDTELMHDVATAIARETKSRGIRQILSPVVNIARDVRWGRVEETYGEDPFLSAAMGVAFVSAFEQNGVVTTPKHFVANVGDGGRDSYPVGASEWLLNEVYFPAFKACFLQGGSQSVMTSYNSLNGQPCTANPWLLRDILKGRWGFDGFVISDAGAVGGVLDLHHTVSNREESAEQSIEAGLDVIFQTSYDHHIPLLKAVTSGMIDEAALDDAVRRVLRAKLRLGLFENPYTDADEAERWNGHPDHRALALEAARRSIVLLKNDAGILPLSKDIRRLAVIGVDAKEGRLGGYSGPGNDIISILRGIEEKRDGKMEVVYHEGCGRQASGWKTVAADYLSYTGNREKKKGLQGTYYNDIDFGSPSVLTRSDRRIDFRWTLFSPDPLIEKGWFSVRWEGVLKAPLSGDVHLGLEGNDGFRLYLDGKLLIDRWKKISWRREVVPVKMEKDREYAITIEFYDNTGRSEVRLIWDAGVEDRSEEKIEEAAELAKTAEAVVVVAGIEEGEFRDRADIGLPGRQADMIRRLAGLGKPVVVVLVGGSAITMEEWIGRVPAVLDVWYPGEQGGYAVADVLFGDYNPAGRLPVTFPTHVAQLPLYYNHFPTGRGDDYMDMTGRPAFPFGHGLSYTRFEYSGLSISSAPVPAGDSLTVSCRIRNAGTRAGDEVVQLYLQDPVSAIVRPVIALKGFQRIRLAPGEEKEVRFTVGSGSLGFHDAQGQLRTEPGTFRILIGASSEDIRLRAECD